MVYSRPASPIQETEGTGTLASGIENANLTLFQMLGSLPLADVTSFVAMILLIIFIVTSADSGALVLDTLASGKKTGQSRKGRIIWAALLGTTAFALLYGGGTTALQAGTIVAALPFAVLVLIITVALCIDLFRQRDGRRR